MYTIDDKQNRLRPTSEFLSPAARSYPNTEQNVFQELSVHGYTNIALRDNFDCEDLVVAGSVNMTRAVDIDDDLIQIADSINHPLVNYASQEKDLPLKELVRRTWSRMGGSSVWLQEQQVYLTVSRVYFYENGVPQWSVVSFLRVQIHDAKWNHRSHYKLHWQGKAFVFPSIFEIEIPYKIGGCFSGPEDPQIILEHSVADAEPVILFNMQAMSYSTKRSMYAFRPFSNKTTKLVLDSAGFAEMNWAPFFLEQSISSDSGQRLPSIRPHLIYEFHLLIILQCHLLSGISSRVFEQSVPTSFASQHRYGSRVLRGGRNFEPLNVSSQSGTTSLVGFPRTHIEEGCTHRGIQREDMAMYRPELTVLSTNRTHFWLDYASESLNFGQSVLTPSELNDPCTGGRVLMVNSIAYFDTTLERDEMALTFSVNDVSVSAACIRGIQRLVTSSPQFSLLTQPDAQIPMRMNMTHRLAGCSIESPNDYALAHIAN